MIQIKKSIKGIPFHLLEQERQRIVNENPDNVEKAWTEYLRGDNSWLAIYGIKDFSNWIYPQLLSLLGDMKVNRNENGLIDGSQFWKDNLDTSSQWWIGVVRFLKIDPRGLTMKETQYTSPGRQYCSLVPIVLAAQKMHKDIPYSHWDRSTLGSVVNKSLVEAMLWSTESAITNATEKELDGFEEFKGFTNEELLEIRNTGLTIKTGKRSGQLNKAQSTSKLCGVDNFIFKGIPALAQVMLTQIWCAHPDNRTEYMILNPENWDSIPEPLVGSLFKKEVTEKPYDKVDYPWDD